VDFTSVEAAKRAIELFNQQNFEGRRLSVQFTMGRGPRATKRNPHKPEHPPTKTLFIGNMAFDMSDRDLNNLFRDIKNVIDVRVAIDRRTGQPRGFAHADFVDVASAQKAMEALKDKEVSGRILRVDFSTSSGRSAMQPAAETEQ
jgi:nucleolin